jgi:5-methylcytosine-specific restriction protein B
MAVLLDHGELPEAPVLRMHGKVLKGDVSLTAINQQALRRALERYARARGQSRKLEVLVYLPPDVLQSNQYGPAIHQVFAYLGRVGQAIRAVAEAAPPLTLTEASTSAPLETPPMTEPLNVILYGPPGTGKTYAVVEEALRRLDPAFLAQRPSREAMQGRFRALQAEERVVFTTFHQNFSYEDFVEGIKPVTTPEGTVTYELQDGVFKTLALRAASPVMAGQVPDLNLTDTVWKFSLDGSSGASAIRTHCLAHGEARVGYPELGRLDTAVDLKGAPRQFVEGLMEGDLVLVPGPHTTVQAVGVVTGEYHYDDAPPAGVAWRNVRPVRWLAQDLQVPFRDVLGVKFTLTTLYRLKPSVSQILTHLATHGVHLAQTPRTPPAHVMVIDEINRGNIAKIFGELITLLEPGKRAGEAEETTVRLPSSKEPFSVPANLFVIGTMNTADRSLARLDTALRRRFEFRELPPRPELLAQTSDGIHLPKLLYTLNRRVALLLGRDFMLGHAYFLELDADSTVEDVAHVFRTRVLPLLEEYFFEDWGRISLALNDPGKLPEDRILLEEDSSAWLPDTRGTVRTYRVSEEALRRVTAFTGIYDGTGGTPPTFPPDIEGAGQDDTG